MKDQTNEESLDPVPGELPDTAGRPGAASAQNVEKNGAAPVDPDALFRQVLDGANLNLAWKQVKANKGAPGVDGMIIDESSWPIDFAPYIRARPMRAPSGQGH